MKTHPQSTAALTHVCELIEGMRIAMLTCSDDDGALVSRPMAVLEMDADGALWFFTDLRSAKVKHLRSVNLSFADVEHGTYVSLSGRGDIFVDHARIEQLWTPFARPWFPDGTESQHLALLKFVPHAAEYWDAPNSKMVRTFAIAASVLLGKPVGLGEHDSLTELSPRMAAA